MKSLATRRSAGSMMSLARAGTTLNDRLHLRSVERTAFAPMVRKSISTARVSVTVSSKCLAVEPARAVVSATPGNNGGDTAQRGQDIEGDILVTLGEVLHGATRTIQIQRTEPHTGKATTQTLRVKIPVGVREGQKIRLPGSGQEGIGGGEAGHLYLRVTFAKHPDFRVRGANLYYDLELSPWEAALGATIQIPTLEGKASLKIPPCTAAEREFRLRGKGLPSSDGTHGDLHAVVSIQMPPELTPEEKTLWEQLAAASTFNPRNSP